MKRDNKIEGISNEIVIRLTGFRKGKFKEVESKNGSCLGCYFEHEYDCMIGLAPNDNPCSSELRSDGKSIIFKKL